MASDYYLSCDLSNENEAVKDDISNRPTSSNSSQNEEIYRPFKKQRTGLVEPSKLHKSSSNTKLNGEKDGLICGLHLLTHYCSKMEEFEIHSTSK